MRNIDVHTVLAQLSLKEIRGLLRRKEKEKVKAKKLKARKAILLKKLNALDAELKGLSGAEPAAAGGRRGGRGGGRVEGKPTIKELAREYLESVGGKASSGDIVKHIAQVRHGRAPTLMEYSSISTAFRNDPRIRRVARGLYKLAKRRGRPAGQKAGGKNGRKRRRGPGRPKKIRGKLTDHAFAFLSKGGGRATLADVFNAVLGASGGRRMAGMRMALRNDKRFAHPGKGIIALA